jgi:DNA phosphorothioation-dependent restriction protein DptG
VTAENAVLLNEPGKKSVEFYVRNDFWASSLAPKPFGHKSVLTVPVKSFNAEIEAFAPNLIVCDIEGGELDLFLNSNLTGVTRVYLEIHQKNLGRMGVKRLFDAFSARNFHYDQHHSKGAVVLFSSVNR